MNEVGVGELKGFKIGRGASKQRLHMRLVHSQECVLVRHHHQMQLGCRKAKVGRYKSVFTEKPGLQGCQITIGATYQNGKMYQMTTKCTK
jgi:hypothetical protein